MNHKSAVITLALVLLALVPAFGQTNTATTTPTMPTYVIAGAAVNAGSEGAKLNFFGSAIYPVSVPLKTYTSSTVFATPMIKTINGRRTITATTQVRQDFHRRVYQSGRTTLLIGGGAGGAFSQASPDGTNLNLAAGFVGTLVHRFSERWGIAIPIQGAYVSGFGWAFAPAVGILYKP